jgi:phage regulator Rha-like protein
MNNTSIQTMSSREIAELTGKRHDNVMADIKKMLIELDLHSPEFSGQYHDSTGRLLPCFNLPKRETLILVSGYSVVLRSRIIDRWQELEVEVIKPLAVPTTYVEALRLAADEAERRMAAEAALQEARRRRSSTADHAGSVAVGGARRVICVAALAWR